VDCWLPCHKINDTVRSLMAVDVAVGISSSKTCRCLHCFVAAWLQVKLENLHIFVSAVADSNIEKLRTSSSDEDDEYYDAEGKRSCALCVSFYFENLYFTIIGITTNSTIIE